MISISLFGSNRLVIHWNITFHFRLNTANIEATAGEDYTSVVNKDISISTTTTQIIETISISNDGILENDETFSITVTSLSALHLAAVNPPVTVVTITDDDSKAIAEC